MLLQKAWWQNGSSALLVFVFLFVLSWDKPVYLCWGQLACCRWRQWEWAMNSLDRRGALSTLLILRLLTLIQDGAWGSRLLKVGGRSWLLSPAMLSCLGSINQLGLFSHSFRHLWYHPGLPLQSVRGMGTYSSVTDACFQRCCIPQILLTLVEYPLTLVGSLWVRIFKCRELHFAIWIHH